MLLRTAMKGFITCTPVAVYEGRRTHLSDNGGVLAVNPSKHSMLKQCWFDVVADD